MKYKWSLVSHFVWICLLILIVHFRFKQTFIISYQCCDRIFLFVHRWKSWIIINIPTTDIFILMPGICLSLPNIRSSFINFCFSFGRCWNSFSALCWSRAQLSSASRHLLIHNIEFISQKSILGFYFFVIIFKLFISQF